MALAAGLTVAAWGRGAANTPPVPPGGAYLGVIVEKLPPETAARLHTNGGALIETVDQDGPACQAGLKSGDVVTAYNGKPVSDAEQLAGMIGASAPGSTASLTVWRNGHSQDIKVKLGDRKQLTAMPMGAPTQRPLTPVGTMPPAPPAPPMPSVEVPGYSPLLARSGILVEPLSPQLCEFFGVPQSQGVLVRSVDRGSPGAIAGLKAGDVVVTANNETIHDMQDWKRALKVPGGHVTLSVVRERKPVTLILNLPTNTSELKSGDAAALEQEMEAVDAELQMLGPEFERQAHEMARSMKPSMEEWANSVRDFELQWKQMEPEFQKQMEEFQKQWQQEMQEWEKTLRESFPRQM